MTRKIVIAIICCLFFIPSVCSQEERAEEDPDYSYGEVLNSSSEDFDVLEYDYEKDEEQVVKYSVHSETVFTNFRALTQLAKGDSVEVYFTKSSGNRVAQTVIRDGMNDQADGQAASPEEGSSSAPVP
jgi:hypothetical protein